jgi:DNA modification methylase
VTGIATILRADARTIPLPDASVDLIVTSPPYFSLRSYQDGGEHYGGQIGAEPTPREYIATLIDCTREWMRVLKPSGSIWVNLGDKYAGNVGTTSGHRGNRQTELNGWSADRQADFNRSNRSQPNRTGVANKSLMMLPERYRIAAVDELGLIARAVVIWSKPNGLPESVTDRVRRSHEDWVHLTKQPRYYSAVDEIRTPASGYSRPGRASRETPGGQRPRAMADTCNPLGALPGSVWEIASEPLKVPEHLGVDHFAAFPTEWPRRIILGWSPSGICVECGEGRRPITTSPEVEGHDWAQSQQFDRIGQAVPNRRTPSALGYRATERQRAITGEACACREASAPTRPAVVVDPFGGTGTTALVAKVLGRHGISVDRSADYCRLARWRTTDPGQLAKAMRVTAPAKEFTGQGDLLELFPAGAAS